MKNVRGAIEDEGPRATRLRDEPHRILTGLHCSPFDEHVLTEAHARGRVGTGVPHVAPLHERRVTEQHSAARDGATVRNSNVSERDRLFDSRALARWKSLRRA